MNYYDLINIKYHVKKFLLISIFIFLLLLIYIFNLNIYENYITYGYITDGLLNVKIQIEFPDILNKLEYIKIGSKEYKAEIVDISEVLLDEENLINYQMVKLKLSDRLYNNQAFRVDIFYNQEKVYKKLKKIIF